MTPGSMTPGMANGDDGERARRFKTAALPHLDDVYTLARYLLGGADAEDAVQECYLRAFRHFDTFRGPAVKPWLFAILRNVCRSEYARRAARRTTSTDAATDDAIDNAEPLWSERTASPEDELVRHTDGETMRRLVAALPDVYREALVLREMNDLSYREIAEIVGTPVGTVMSRLARARTMLRTAWLAAEQDS
jgi:RNA polymerase sigma-70 factor, ECF subfamily